MLVKSVTVYRGFYFDKHVYIGLTSYCKLKPEGVAKILFVQNLSSCCSPSAVHHQPTAGLGI